MTKRKRDLLTRYQGNPVITANDIVYKNGACKSISNSAVVKHAGEYLLLGDAYMADSNSEFRRARSRDGYHFTVQQEPVLENSEHKRFYDPRATKIGDVFYITFGVDYPTGEVTTGLAMTKDFEKFNYLGEISQPDTRNTVLFPEKIDGYYVKLNRPFPLYYHWGWPAGMHPAVKEGKQWPATLNIWLSRSPDLIFWGKSEIVLKVQDVPWASHRLGPGAPPIKTAYGWLTIFHGAELTAENKKIYRFGCMLLDLKNPSKVIGRIKDPILEPQEPYERQGCVPEVVFPCAAIPEENGELKIYYGGADTCVCVATANIDQLVRACLENGKTQSS